MELLNELNNRGKTIVVSTHDIDLAYPWAHRAILLVDGQILQEGIPEVAFGDRDLVRRAHLSNPPSSSTSTTNWRSQGSLPSRRPLLRP